MPNPALTAILGIDPSKFLSGISKSEASLKDLDRAVKLSAAEVAKFEQNLTGEGTKEQLAQVDALKTRHREIQLELKNTTRQMAAFQTAADLAPKGAQSDGERYESLQQEQAVQREMARRAQVAAEGAATVTPARARYEAHRKKLEEKAQAQQEQDAEKDKLQRMRQFQRERDALVRESKAQEENELLSSGSSGSGRPRGEGSEEGAGNTRMRDQELAHSARSFSDMLFAGVNPLRALEMEGPRLVQAFGGGLGAILGIGTAVAGVAALAGKIYECGEVAKELHRESERALNGDTTQGQQSVQALTERIRELDAAIAKDTPASGFFSRVSKKGGDIAAWMRQLVESGANFAATGQVDLVQPPGEQRQQDTTANEDKRAEKLKQIVAAEKQITDIQEDGFKHGQDAVRWRANELERQNKISDVESAFGIPKLREDVAQARTPEEKERATKDLEDKEKAVKGLIEQLNHRYDIQANITQIDVDKNAISRAAAAIQAGIGHVNLNNPDGSTNTVNLPPGFGANNVQLQKLHSERSKAMAILQDTEAHGGDTKGAKADLLRAETAYRDAAIDEALKTPQQRRQEADTYRNRQQAEGRLAHPNTMDADHGESRIGSAEGNVTTGGFDDHFRKNPNRTKPQLPDEGFHSPLGGTVTAAEVRQGATNAGKSDGAGSEKLIQAINNPAWVQKTEGLFKNK